MAWNSEASRNLVFGACTRVELYSYPVFRLSAPRWVQLHMSWLALSGLLSRLAVGPVLDSSPPAEHIVR